MEPFFHGFILALGLILPLGVQNVFIFNQGALQPKYIKVLPAVITASLCDTLLILVSVLGVSIMILGLFWFKVMLIAAGVIFLLYMGWSTWNSKPVNEKEERTDEFSIKKQIMFAASVSLLNPHAILDTIGVIGTSSLSYQGEEKTVFTIACILVSWIWFLGLSLIGRITGNLDKTGSIILFLNKISALVMWGAAVYLLLTFVH